MTDPIEANLMENAAIAVFAIDTTHCVSYWNRACERLTGVDADAVLGTDLHMQVFSDPARPCLSDLLLDGRYEQIVSDYDHCRESKLSDGGYHAEGWLPDLGDRSRYVTIDASMVYSRSGEVAGAVEVIQDISEFKLNRLSRDVPEPSADTRPLLYTDAPRSLYEMPDYAECAPDKERHGVSEKKHETAVDEIEYDMAGCTV